MRPIPTPNCNALYHEEIDKSTEKAAILKKVVFQAIDLPRNTTSRTFLQPSKAIAIGIER